MSEPTRDTYCLEESKGKVKELEQLLQVTIELRASDLKMQEELMEEKKSKIFAMEKLINKYQKEKERDRSILKLKENALASKVPIPENELLKKEIAMLREYQDSQIQEYKALIQTKESNDTLSQKIAEQNEYFFQLSKYLKEVTEEKELLILQLSGDKQLSESERINALITRIKLDYGEKIEELSKRYIE